MTSYIWQFFSRVFFISTRPVFAWFSDRSIRSSSIALSILRSSSWTPSSTSSSVSSSSAVGFASRTVEQQSLLFECRLVFLCYHIQARMNQYDMGDLQGIVSSEEDPLFPPKYRRASLRYYPHVVYRRASLKPIIGRHGKIFFNKKAS